MLQPIHPPWGSLALDRSADASLQDQIAAFFRDGISSGRLPRGRRVPSSRELAQDFGISRTTAVEAYDRLVAEGYLVARPGAGLFVAEIRPEDYQVHTDGAQRGRRNGTTRYGQLPPGAGDMSHYQLPLAPGMPAIDHFPWGEWAKLTAQIYRERPQSVLAYGDPRGELELRAAIAEYLGAARAIICNPDQIVLCSGTVQVVELAARVLVEPGESVWFEDPGYPFVRSVIQAAALKPVPLPVDSFGLDVDAGMRQAPDARLALVAPSHAYPLGTTMTSDRRTALIDWAESADAWIFENETDGDYRFTAYPQAPLYAVTRTERVIYCGSLSKPLAPGLRINYLVVPEHLVGVFARRTTLAPVLTQLTLARFNAGGRLTAHFRQMRVVHARRRALLLGALQSEAADLLEIASEPEAGLRLVTHLLADVGDVRIARLCLEAGIKVEPLSVCYAGEPCRSGLVVGFASTPEAQIETAVRTLAGVIRAAI